MNPSPPVRRLALWSLLLLVAALVLPATAPATGLRKIGDAGGGQPAFLRAEEAFQLVPSRTATGVTLAFEVTPGHYLYRDRFRFSAEGPGLTPGEPAFSAAGEWKDDPSFGRVRVYHESVTVTLPLRGEGRLRVRWQGCADAGLCYPPQEQVLAVDARGVTAVADTPAATRAGALTAGVATPEAPAGRATQWLVFFLMGLGLSLTPCVLPMLPILAGIIARQHTSSALRGLTLALAYVLGVATVYALLGGLVGYFGQQLNLASWLQRPVVLVPFAALFGVLALSLFGLFELRLPAALASRFHGLSQRQQGGALAGSYLMGLFSSLVVSPCVSAPLVGVLLHVSAVGSSAFGAVSLFLLALGMGVPLLLLGATEGRLLPKSGAWMNEVKTFFGLLLLFVGAELLSRVLPPPAALALYGACTAATGLWLWRLGGFGHGPGLLARAGGFAALVYAALLFTGAAAGGDDPLRPLAPLGGNAPASQPTPFVRIRTNADLDREIALARQEGKALMLDFYADWCVSCKLMERNVFRRPEVAARLAKLRLVQADVTANNEDDRALLRRFNLMGPPSIVFFDKDGNEMAQARLVGEKDADGFLAHLDSYGL
ncbi:MAG TPA: protein-disulfide reductase DsbD [Moraxellaceae bacterium]|nr:protein-disulfide reductase DsbD [Moraxellaceae bacterium]